MRNLLWFIAGGLAVGLAFLTKSPYLAYAGYVFLLLLTLAHISSRLWLIGLDCERDISATTVQQGDEVDVSVRVTNRRGWPIPWIYLEDKHPPYFQRTGVNKRLAVLMPGQSVDVNYRLQCPRRGYHPVGPMLFESGDLFGLQKRFMTGRRRDYVSVLPTVAYIDTFNVASRRPQGPVRISNRVYEDPSRIAGLREYAPGDPMKRVHWKASARTGQLFVKTNEPSAVQGGTLLLDLHEDSYFPPEDAERWRELAITTTASIGYLLQMSGEQVGLLTNARDAAEVARWELEGVRADSRQEADAAMPSEDEQIRLSPLHVPTARGPLQAQRIIENLARVTPTNATRIERVLMAEFMRLPRDAALLPVVPIVAPDFALALGSMKLSGFNVSVFLVGGEKAYWDAAEALAPHGIYVFHIEQEASLHELSPARIGQ